MKLKTVAIAFLLTMFCNTVFAETIHVDAIENCLGPNGGRYKRVIVERGLTYEITLESNNAIFNTNDGARIVNVGVMYIQPPRKMTIKTIESDKKTYVETEGNLLFFFVDDARLNSGGARLNIRKVNR